MSLGLLTLLVLVALIIEGFFSGSEMALISADRLVLHRMAQGGSKGAKLALELMSRPERVLATTLIGTNTCVALMATLTTIHVHQRSHAAPYEVLLLSPLILLVGEVLPKTIYQRYAEQLAPIAAPLIQLASWVFSPVTWLLGRYTDWLSRQLQPIEELVTGRQHPSHREELRYLLTFGQKETSLKTSERRMIKRILDFSKAEARNALLPLVKIDMIEDALTVSEALDAFQRFGHSRLPVYHERVDNVVGVVNVFDVFSEADGTKPITALMKPPYYAPESQQLENLLYTMQKRGISMSIVVDEYGGAVGILTVEDILEEIVGEIKDEYDQDTALYREVSPGEYLIQGQMEIAAINEALKLNLPRGDYETLAGFLLQQFDRIPDEGDELYYGDYKFVVRKASNRSIQAVALSLVK